MLTEIQQKQEIINRLNLVPKKRLEEIDLFIRFILYEAQQSDNQDLENEDDEELEDDFFAICGIWKNRDIDINSLREKAWRKYK